MSGAPLRERAIKVLLKLNEYVEGRIPIVASGGIMDADDAIERVEDGASLVQLYTGLIYRGPQIVKEIATRLG